MRPFLIAAVALLAVGIANIDVHPTRTIVKRVPVTRTVTKTKVVERRSDEIPSGYMTRADCEALKSAKNMDIRQIIYRWGWPAGRNGEDSSSDTLYYSLAEDHGTECQVGFYQGKLDDVDIEEDWL